MVVLAVPKDQDPSSPDRIGAWWKRTCKKPGIDPELRLHDLCYWSPTHQAAGGQSVRSVAGRLGHADSSATVRTEAHVSEGLDGLIADTVAGVFDGEADE